MNDWCFRPRFCTGKDILGRRQPRRNEMNFVMNHDPDAGLIARPIGQQFSALPLLRMPSTLSHMQGTTYIISQSTSEIVTNLEIKQSAPVGLNLL